MSSFIITSKFVTLPSGAQLYTERASHPDAVGSTPSQTIVFLHGLVATVNMFHGIFDALLSALPTTSLIAYDTTGTGLSPVYPPRLKTTLTKQTILEDFEALVSAEVPSGPVVIVAHSASTTLISQFLASSSPLLSRVTHVVFLGGPMKLPITPETAAERLGMAQVLGTQGTHIVVDGLVQTFSGSTTIRSRPTAVALLRSMCLTQPKEGQAAVIRAFVLGANKALEFGKFHEGTKVLIIGGEEDVIAPKDTLIAISKEIKGAKLVWLKNVGHCPPVESPIECAQAIINFLKE